MSNYQSVNVTSEPTGAVAPDQTPAPSAQQAADAGDDPVGLPSASEPVDRPTWLPTKFKSPEDMAKAYLDLEKRLGSGKPADPPKAGDKPAETPPADNPAPGLITETELATLQTEFEKAGRLSDAQYEALAKKGLPRQMVDGYIAGQQALAERQVAQVFETVGGRENYEAMIGWARENLSPEARAAYDAAVDSRDMGRATLAVQGLYAQFSQANARPNLVKGKAAGAGVSGNAFRSNAEVIAAMSDPRYERDEAYRQDVAARLKGSNILE